MVNTIKNRRLLVGKNVKEKYNHNYLVGKRILDDQQQLVSTAGLRQVVLNKGASKTASFF